MTDPLAWLVFGLMFVRMAADSFKVHYIVKKKWVGIFIGSVMYNLIWIITLWITFMDIVVYAIPAVIGGGVGSVFGVWFRVWMKNGFKKKTT
jgi:hypothetical protein